MTQNGTSNSVITRQRPRRHLSLKLLYHYLISKFAYLILVPLLAVASLHLSNLTSDDLLELRDHLQNNVVSVIISSTLLLVLSTIYLMWRPQPVYLLDFSCYKPEDARKVTREIFMQRSELAGTFTEVQFTYI